MCCSTSPHGCASRFRSSSCCSPAPRAGTSRPGSNGPACLVAGRCRPTSAAAIALGRPTRDEIAVFYGHRRLPAPGEPVEGGMVKFQRLQSVYPNRPRDFNLLYLGSSSLPSDEQAVIRLAKRRRAPIVVNQNGVAYPGWAGARTDELNDRLRTVLRRADHVVYQSQFCKSAADRFLGAAPGEWEVLRNAVDTSEFTPADEAPA